MSRRTKRAKPKSPLEIAAEKAARAAEQRARDFSAVGLQERASTLSANDAVEVTRAGPKTVDGAKRKDAFDALRDKMLPGAYDAARKLQNDIRVRRGEDDPGRPLTRVDCDRGRDRMDRALAAGERVDGVLGRIGMRDAWLLSELISPHPLDRPWREIVGRVTGEENHHAQAAAVRAACANLYEAYQELEGKTARSPTIRRWAAEPVLEKTEA